METARRILVTGASGYVGGRLVTALLEDNAKIRVFVRDRNKAQSHSWASQVEIAVGNASDYQSTVAALTNVHTAFYLLHSINLGPNFDQIESEMARNFAKAAEECGVKQIIYLGGINNDGGSALISTGLLVNNDPSCGIPLTSSDGIDTMTVTPFTWFDAGVVDFTSGNDSTIFGSLVPKKEFISTGFELRNSGVTGVNLDSNQIIIAQLTTQGDLSFKINLELEELVNGVPTIVKYVAKDTLLVAGEIFSPFLSYPQSCGCDDPDFLEYNSSYVCYLEGSCQTPIKIGCMDSMACNYDPEVNLNIENLCCYPGKCNNRDIAVVCPELRGDSFEFLLHPNPVNGTLYLDVYSGFLAPITYTIFNTFGVKIIEKTLDPALIITGEAIETSTLDNGLYHIQVQIGNIVSTQLFIKN